MMDRNSLIGMFLILLIVLGYGYLTMPNEEELKAMKHKQDSIALVDSLSKIKHVEIKQAVTDTVE